MGSNTCPRPRPGALTQHCSERVHILSSHCYPCGHFLANQSLLSAQPRWERQAAGGSGRRREHARYVGASTVLVLCLLSRFDTQQQPLGSFRNQAHSGLSGLLWPAQVGRQGATPHPVLLGVWGDSQPWASTGAS